MTEIKNQKINQNVQNENKSLWKWFNPINWITGFIAFAISFTTYVYTLQPTVGLEDSGELICGAYTLGVPHPPGYPMWSILSKLFTFIPVGDVAFRVNLLSAMCSALAAGMIALVLAKTADIFFGKQEEELGTHHLLPAFERLGLTTPRLINSLCAITAGVLFAYTPGTWSQSTIAEVYAFTCFYMALLVTLSLVFMFNPHKRILFCLIAFFFAQGFTNHQTLIVMVPSLLWVAWVTKKDFEQFVILAINALLWFIFAKLMFGSAARMYAFNASNGGFFLWFVGPFIAYLVVSYFINKIFFKYGEWGKLLGSLYLGLGIYLYLPIASASNPQLNWGRARTVEGFWHSVLRGQYEKPHFMDRNGNRVSDMTDFKHFFRQCWAYMKDTWDQYPLVLIFAFLSVLAIIVLWKKTRMRDWLIFSVITFLFCGLGMVFLMNPKLDITSQYINRVFFVMGHAGLALLVGYGMISVAALFPALARRKNNLWKTITLVISGIFVVYGIVLTLGMQHFFSSQLPAYFNYFGLVFIAIGCLSFISILVSKISYLASIGIALCLLITPFIPAKKEWGEMNLRKKYFGYIYGIEMLKYCEPGAIFYGGTDPGRFVPLYMINCDKFRSDVWLITQNGLADATYMNVLRDRYCKPKHIWGWAKTLLKALDAEREDHKGENTIYIPSTKDFERAFKIYIDRVKERRARGENIEEEVNIVDGKISVGGVAGVMRLNGILTEMIWKENKAKHSFYVEESYVIPWMYPYLEPAGMIMKLCAEKTTITPEKVKKDFDYWNNITNMFDNGGMIEFEDLSPKLVEANPDIVKLFCNVKADGRKGKILIKPGEFQDDVTAQKSFSKCRSAIAGVYEYRQLWDAAANAYKQAIWLYPKSAEAYMRLANMYMKIGKFDAAYNLAVEYKSKDPLNTRVDGMISAIDAQRRNNKKFVDMQRKVNAGTNVSWQEYLQFAQYNDQRGSKRDANKIFDMFLNDNSPATNAEVYQALASLLQQRQDITRLTKLFEKMAQANPKDWNALINLAFIRFAGGANEQGFDCIKKAMLIDKNKVVQRLWQDPRFKALRENPNPKIKERFMQLVK